MLIHESSFSNLTVSPVDFLGGEFDFLKITASVLNDPSTTETILASSTNATYYFKNI